VVADIVPVLAAITGLDQASADQAFADAWGAAKKANGGRADTKSYVEAIMAFRAALPFDLADLQAGQKAKQELDKKLIADPAGKF
jgi:hypothetical protein